MKLKAENLLSAAGLSLAASVLVPMFREMANTGGPGVFAGVLGISDRARKGWSLVQEEVEDFLAEVQFERLRNRIDREIGGGPR